MSNANATVLTVGEAAEELRVSAAYVRRLCDEGRLACMRTRSGVRILSAESVAGLRASRTARA